MGGVHLSDQRLLLQVSTAYELYSFREMVRYGLQYVNYVTDIKRGNTTT